MTFKALVARSLVDPYGAMIVGMAVLASVLPVYGEGAVVGGYVTETAIRRDPRDR
jgi:hypothetical protein